MCICQPYGRSSCPTYSAMVRPDKFIHSPKLTYNHNIFAGNCSLVFMASFAAIKVSNCRNISGWFLWLINGRHVVVGIAKQSNSTEMLALPSIDGGHNILCKCYHLAHLVSVEIKSKWLYGILCSRN